MAKLEQRGLSLEIKNIKALYCEDDDFQDNNVYTYEAFDIFLKINDKNIPDTNGTYELCSGNIEFLIDSINECIINKKDVFCEFIEPNFSFELKYVNDKYVEFITWCHDEGFSNGAYGNTAVGFRYSLCWSELVNFEEQLRYEFNHKKKLLYKDYKEIQRRLYEGE